MSFIAGVSVLSFGDDLLCAGSFQFAHLSVEILSLFLGEAAAGISVYFASANATTIAFLTRLFYSTPHIDKFMKVGASAIVARRGGLSATYDEINKFFGISNMPIASGQYWNSLHGRAPGEVEGDEEGLQGMRTLARNMAFLMKSIALGKEQIGLPEREKVIFTNFIR